MVLKVVMRSLTFLALSGGMVFALAACSGSASRGMEISAVTTVAPTRAGIELPPDVVYPEECQVEPRSVDELLETVHAAYAGTLPAAVEPDGPVTVESTVETVSITVDGISWIVDGDVVADAPGPVADDATVVAVTLLLRERVACQNAGDAPRFLALHTDAWVNDSFTSAAEAGSGGNPHVPEESWEALLTSDLYEVYEPDWRAAPEIAGVWSLPDGRVAVIAIPGASWREEHGSYRSPAELLILSNSGGTWLVDFSHNLDSTSASRDGA